MSNTFFQGGQKILHGVFAPLVTGLLFALTWSCAVHQSVIVHCCRVCGMLENRSVSATHQKRYHCLDRDVFVGHDLLS